MNIRKIVSDKYFDPVIRIANALRLRVRPLALVTYAECVKKQKDSALHICTLVLLLAIQILLHHLSTYGMVKVSVLLKCL